MRSVWRRPFCPHPDGSADSVPLTNDGRPSLPTPPLPLPPPRSVSWDGWKGGAWSPMVVIKILIFFLEDFPGENKPPPVVHLKLYGQSHESCA